MSHNLWIPPEHMLASVDIDWYRYWISWYRIKFNLGHPQHSLCFHWNSLSNPYIEPWTAQRVACVQVRRWAPLSLRWVWTALLPRGHCRPTAGRTHAPATSPAAPRAPFRPSSPALSRAPCPLMTFTQDCVLTPATHTANQVNDWLPSILCAHMNIQHCLIYWCFIYQNLMSSSLFFICCFPQAGQITLRRLKEWPINRVASRELDFSVGLCLCLSVCISSLLA